MKTWTTEQLYEQSTTEPNTGCWLWTRGVAAKMGYASVYVGRSRTGGRNAGGHRLAWAALHGAVPAGMCVCHRCDQPSCVNPDHLFLGSHRDNTRDMIRKGRKPVLCGEKSPTAVRTESTVREVLRSHRGGEGPTSIARRMGMTLHAAKALIYGRKWRRVREAIANDGAP